MAVLPFGWSYAGRQGEVFRSAQAHHAAVTSGSPAAAPPIPHMVGVLRSASACCDSPKWSGLARVTAAHISGARPRGRVYLALPASTGFQAQDGAGIDIATGTRHTVHLIFSGAGGWAGLHCARHHPLQLEAQRVPGTPSAYARNESILSARCASTTGSPAAPPLFPVCATREHVRLPGHHMPVLVCGMREHGD